LSISIGQLLPERISSPSRRGRLILIAGRIRVGRRRRRWLAILMGRRGEQSAGEEEKAVDADIDCNS